MANPSLQIGNSNWAIKEDNLLGYSTAGTKFLPQPITMTRASAGTRVNPQGLIETVELLGSELVVNGDFATRSNWTMLRADYDVTTNPNKATITNSSVNGYIYNTVGMPTVIGRSYNVKVNYYGTLSTILGTNPVVKYDNVGGGGSVYGSRTITSAAADELIDFNFVATTSVFWVSLFSPTNADIHVWGNVSVKESTKNNLARVDYDGTASSLLVEPQRTNRFLYSEDLTQFDLSSSGTGALNPTVTSNYGVSPDGTQNADRVQFNAGTDSSGNSRITESFTIFATEETISVYLKSNDNQEHTIDIIQSNQAQNSVTVTTEWQRFSFSNVNGSPDKYGIGLTGGNAETADILAWGFQLEQASYPTSYIPTSGSTVTRVQDQYSKTGISNLIGQTEGTMYCEVGVISGYDTNNLILTLSNGTNQNQIYINRSNGKLEFFISNSLVYLAPSILTNGIHKLALAYKQNDFAVSIDGVIAYTDTNGNVPTCNKINVGSHFNGNLPYNDKINDVKIYKTRLTNPELIALTTI